MNRKDAKGAKHRTGIANHGCTETQSHRDVGTLRRSDDCDALAFLASLRLKLAIDLAMEVR